MSNEIPRLERLFIQLVVAIHDILGSDSLGSRLERDGDPVLVGAANKERLLALETQIAGVNIGGYVHSGQVSDMHRPVGVGQCRSDKRSFKSC